MTWKYEYLFNESRQKRPETDKRLLLAFLGGVVLDIVFYCLGLDLPYRVLRAVLGLAFVLFIPGYIATHVFFKDEVDEIERIALSVGLSISLVVLTVMFSNLALKIPINFGTIVIEILAICGVFYGIVRLQESHVFDGVIIPKKTLYIASGAALISLIFIADIFYPAMFAGAPQESRSDMKKITLRELYDRNMTVMRFYPQKGLSENLTGVAIPETSVVVFDGNVALLSSSIDKTDLNVGDTFHITYYWASVNATDKNYSAKVDITDAGGKVLFNQNHNFPAKLNGRDVMIEEYDVKVPKMNEGTYLIRAGLSDAKVTSGSFIDTQNRAIIGMINVHNATLNFSELYNENMIVKRFYSQKKIQQTTSGIKIQNPVVVDFDKSIALLGYSIDKTSLKAGETFNIAYFWKSLDAVDINYTAFVHFTNETGAVKFQQDHGLPLKTALWRQGDIIMEVYDVKVPVIPAGEYAIRIGLYDSSGTKQRMPVFSGPADKENRAVIGTFNVTQ